MEAVLKADRKNNNKPINYAQLCPIVLNLSFQKLKIRFFIRYYMCSPTTQTYAHIVE